MGAYYNDHEKYVCEWLKNLSAAELIAPGVVDDRDIKSVAPEDLRPAAQCHFFAGIGTWSYALRLAGVPDDFRVWTASLPCQPFSQAGQGKGFDDERHLWPDFFELVKKCRPQWLTGEQSASPGGLKWLDAVQADLESVGYTVGYAVLASAWVGAPHIRHRIYWVAYSEEFRWPQGWNGRARTRLDEAWEQFERHGDAGELADAVRARRPERRTEPGNGSSAGSSSARELADTDRERLEGERLLVRERGPLEDLPEAPRRGEVVGMADSDGGGRGSKLGDVRAREPDAGGCHEVVDGVGDAGRTGSRGLAGELLGAEGERRGGPRSGSSVHEPRDPGEADGAARELGDTGRARLPEQLREPGVARGASGGEAGEATLRAGPPTRGFWTNAEWRYCRDGRYRPTEPGVEPLAHGVAGRVGAIKAYGNAINPLCAATFIRAFMESTQHLCG